MRALITLLVAASFLVIPLASFAAAQKSSQGQLSENTQTDIRQLKQDVKTTASDVEILRRDQINYRIEKDLLKEAYSSNLQIVTIVITIVYGVFGVLGYLGIRSIKEVKSEYANELNELKKLKTSLEMELQALVKKQKEFDKKIGEVTIINKSQDNRLKVLELTEKVNTLIHSKLWKWALEHISVGLEIDHDNVPLLTQKTVCHGKLGEFSSAIDACKRIIELEPEPKDVMVINLLEFLALSNQKDEFENIYAAHKNKIDQYESGHEIYYLNALLCLITGDLGRAVESLSTFAKKFPGVTKQYLGTWTFDEALNVASKLPAGKQKDILVKTVQFFDGKISSDDFVAYLAQ